MKLVANTADLIAALKTVTPAVAKGASLPGLHGVHITAEGTRVALTCTNLDLRISDGFDVMVVDEPGTVIVPAAALLRIAIAADSDDIMFATTDDGDVNIAGGSINAGLRTIPADTWPAEQTFTDSDPIELGPNVVDAIGRVAHAASADMSRPALTGVRFAGRYIAAPDSYRAAWIDDVGADIPETTVPASAVKIVLDVADSGSVIFEAFDKLARFTIGDTVITTNVIASDFPNLAPLIPTDERINHTATVDKAALLATLKRATAIDGSDPVATFSLDDGSLSIRRVEADIGTLEVATDATLVGEPIKFNLSIRYLTDVLNSYVDDSVVFELQDDLKPLRFIDEQVGHLVMPVRGGSR